MADVIVKLKIMPGGIETDLKALENAVKSKIEEFGGMVHKTETIPIAFGLNSLEMVYLIDESKGSTEPLEKEISEVDGVEGVEVIDVRRAFG